MTSMSFDPLAIYYIIALVSIVALGLAYTAISEHWYWKGWKDGKGFGQRHPERRYSGTRS
jgi:hypothetical protein